MRTAVVHEILDVMPEGICQKKAHTVLAHRCEAWRCWEANILWKVSWIPPPFEAIILRYVKAKVDWWVQNIYYMRENFSREGNIDKNSVCKFSGRLTWLYFKRTADIQSSYLTDGPFLLTEEAVAMKTVRFHWLENRQF
jgi:hypothetical protein